jgi:hypothetical protein
LNTSTSCSSGMLPQKNMWAGLAFIAKSFPLS